MHERVKSTPDDLVCPGGRCRDGRPGAVERVLMTATNYRTPEAISAECQRQADRYERQGQPCNAADYRAAVAESDLMAARINAVLSVEIER